MENSNGHLRKWYPDARSLQSDIPPGFCVIARKDISFGLIVFSDPVLQSASANLQQEMERDYAMINLNFRVYKSFCMNCREKEITEGTNVCPDCIQLFNRMQEQEEAV